MRSDDEIYVLRDNITDLANKLHASEANLAEALKLINIKDTTITSWIKQNDALSNRVSNFEYALQEAEDEIIRLKAKLYDATEGDAK